MMNKHLDCITDTQWSCKTWRRNGFKGFRAKPNQLRRRREVPEHSNGLKKPNSMFSVQFSNFMRPCEELSWNYERSTPHRSETHGNAERALCQSLVSLSFFFLFFQLPQGRQCLFEVRSVPDLHGIGTNLVRTNPPITL